jgi:hypothetical protein
MITHADIMNWLRDWNLYTFIIGHWIFYDYASDFIKELIDKYLTCFISMEIGNSIWQFVDI